MTQEKRTLLLPAKEEDGKIIIALPKEFFDGKLSDYEGKVVIRRNIDAEIKECPIITETSSKEEKMRALICEYIKILKEEGKHD